MARTQLIRLRIALALVFLLVLSAPARALLPLNQPSWLELTAEQQEVLSPLANDWDSMEPYRKKKWLGIAQRFSALRPEEKDRVRARMKEWARLTPAERKAARDSFASLRKAPPEHHETMKKSIQQKWQEYSDLPEDEKKRLQSDGSGKNIAPGRPIGIPTPNPRHSP